MNKKQIEELKKRVIEQEKSVHTPYGKTTGCIADFEVEYHIDIDPKIGDVKLSQGMRCDFLFQGDDPNTDGIYMIWPELLNTSGQVIIDKNITPVSHGKATMWIGLDETRKKIQLKRSIKVGTKGFWVVGSHKIASVTVTKIIGLNRKP